MLKHVEVVAANSDLLFLSLQGKEALSQPFYLDVELISTNSTIDIRSLLNTNMTIKVETTGLSTRYLSGVVTDVELLGRQQVTSEYYLYKATVRPSLWYLTQGQDYRIFQEQTVPDILKAVLGVYDFMVDYRLNSSYRNWEYCVQYEESDFNFISRLMEHEGIYYWFEHTDGQHTLVISDDKGVHQSYGDYGTLVYLDEQMNVATDKERVLSWRRKAGITTTKYSTIDYDFRKPNVNLGSCQSHSVAGDRNDSEHYEWQAGYQEIDHGEHYARIRLEQLKVSQEKVQGSTTARGLCPGYTFSLSNHPRHAENQQYLCLEAIYDMSVGGYNTGTGREDYFEIDFIAIPADIQYRAPRITSKPKTTGPQTAQVVGPTGEEVWTDKYGRVKVQFHWDRDGDYDENSSCWVRVSSPWAGGGFGGLQLPRINDEVVVDFIGGNPDRPIILGRVYNEMNMPPVSLPDESHTSGFRTQSVHGDSSTENHFLFIDKIGRELVHVRAQRDKLMTAAHDLSYTIHNHLTVDVGGNEIRNVGSNRTTTVTGFETENLLSGQTRLVEANGRHTTITGLVKDEIEGAIDYEQEGKRTVNLTGTRNLTLTDTDEMEVTDDAIWNFNKNLRETLKRYDNTITGNAEIHTKYSSEKIKNHHTTTVSEGNRSLNVKNYKLISDKKWLVESQTADIELEGTGKVKLDTEKTYFDMKNTVHISGSTVSFTCDNWNDDVFMTFHAVAFKKTNYSSYKSTSGFEAKFVGGASAMGQFKLDFFAFLKLDLKKHETKEALFDINASALMSEALGLEVQK